MRKKTVLTGIKPTGVPHLGNYVGAIRPALRYMEREDMWPMYFIADYHALTTVHDRKELRESVYDVAATWLALGLDPARATFYRQSDVPTIFELSWIIACVTPKGLMNRAHAYKAAVQRNVEAGNDEDAGVDMGLFNYPVLMSADILMFNADIVPVGPDQVQHIEYARDIAQNFNNAFGKTLKLPEYDIPDSVAVPGIDGRKMSKSYNNVLPIFFPSNQLRKAIARIKTDSTLPHEPKDTKSSLLFTFYEQIATAEEVASLAARYEQGISWADVKELVYLAFEEKFAAPRERYNELMANRAEIDTILAEGAERANSIATKLMADVRKAVGARV